MKLTTEKIRSLASQIRDASQIKKTCVGYASIDGVQTIEYMYDAPSYCWTLLNVPFKTNGIIKTQNNNNGTFSVFVR